MKLFEFRKLRSALILKTLGTHETESLITLCLVRMKAFLIPLATKLWTLYLNEILTKKAEHMRMI